MSSEQPAKNGSDNQNAFPSSVPIGVRTHTVVSGRWVAIALAAVLGLAVLVFVAMPRWLTPATRTASPAPAPAAPTTAPAAPAAPAPAGNTAETVRQRLLAEEAATRYREASEALQKRAAPVWAPQEWAAATERADAAASALSTRSYARAMELYDEAVRMLAEISGQSDRAFERALAAGGTAIEARRASDAVKAFQLALAIRPGDGKAQHGLGRAERLDDVLARLAAGEAQEQAGALDQAHREYAEAVRLDSEFSPAKAALARVNGRLAVQRFDRLMTQGLAQLDGSNWMGAEKSFSDALKIRPAHAAATDGLARAKEGLQRESLVRLQREGQAREAVERWDDALAAYRRAETLDPSVVFAREGIARASRMIALHARLDGYLARPERLYTGAVRAEALKLLALLNAEAQAGPRLIQHRQQLSEALRRAMTKVTVRLTSDNLTQVTLHRVGRLGQFQEREVKLTPGTYTLVGSRPGYKDVRLELIIAPETDPPNVFVACREPV